MSDDTKYSYDDYSVMSTKEAYENGFAENCLRNHLKTVALITEGRMRGHDLQPGELFSEMLKDPKMALDEAIKTLEMLKSKMHQKVLNQTERDELAFEAADVVIAITHFVMFQLEESIPKLTSVG